jgi:hypothetical protein
MANTFELIASYSATGSVASIDFTSIPSTYTDLCILLSTRSDRNVGSATICSIEFNGSTTGYTGRNLGGTGAAAYSDSNTTGEIGYTSQANLTASTFGNFAIYIPNYASANYKSFSSDYVSENNATGAYSGLIAGLWSNTAAITSFKIKSAFNFVQYSTAYLYGVKNA